MMTFMSALKGYKRRMQKRVEVPVSGFHILGFELLGPR